MMLSDVCLTDISLQIVLTFGRSGLRPEPRGKLTTLHRPPSWTGRSHSAAKNSTPALGLHPFGLAANELPWTRPGE